MTIVIIVAPIPTRGEREVEQMRWDKEVGYGVGGGWGGGVRIERPHQRRGEGQLYYNIY